MSAWLLDSEFSKLPNGPMSGGSSAAHCRLGPARIVEGALPLAESSMRSAKIRLAAILGDAALAVVCPA